MEQYKQEFIEFMTCDSSRHFKHPVNPWFYSIWSIFSRISTYRNLSQNIGIWCKNGVVNGVVNLGKLNKLGH